MASQDARLSKFKADFKQQQGEMTNKIDTLLKAITDRIARALPSDTIKNPKLGTHPVIPVCSVILPNNEPVMLILADLGSCVNIIPLYLFKKLNIRLLEETDHIFGLADETKSYPVRIVKDVEVYIGKLKLLNDFYVIDMKKDPETPLLVGKGFLNLPQRYYRFVEWRKYGSEGNTRSISEYKGVELRRGRITLLTNLEKKESYKPRSCTEGFGTLTIYMLGRLLRLPFTQECGNC
ncbi:MAK10-like protein [Tanacetum coccineum]